jgi:hypothetical protein
LSGTVSRRRAIIALFTALIAASVNVASAASPVPSTSSATPPPQPAQIDRNTALILIRTTLVALQQANQTGNYSVLYALSAPGFQEMNSPERLVQVFKNLRAKNFDLSGVVVLEPQLTVLPEMYSNGVMRMAGFFPSVPMQLYFDLQFKAVEGRWRLLAIAVDVMPTSGAPNAESPPPRRAQAVRPQNPVVETTGAAKPAAAESPKP